MAINEATHRVLTDSRHIDANVAWAKSEGLDPDDILASDLYVVATLDGFALAGLRLDRNDQGEHYLDGDGFARRLLLEDIATMPPATVRL